MSRYLPSRRSSPAILWWSSSRRPVLVWRRYLERSGGRAARTRPAGGLPVRSWSWRARVGREALELGRDPFDPFLAARLVALGLGGVVADDVALGRVTVADANFLDAEVVAHGAWDLVGAEIEIRPVCAGR